MYAYNGLNAILKERNMSRTRFAKLVGISSRTMAKISRNEKIADHVLRRMADFLECNVADICRSVSDNPILRQLQDEKRSRISGGLYHELQVRMTYNSNHIEGSKLSEAQTRLIFETRTIDAGDGVPVDDIIEAANHFRAIDYCIEHAEETLNEKFIKDIHYILKRGTKDEELDWFAVGDYKKRPNMVGGRETASPKDVHPRMQRLISDYLSKENISVEDIIIFHAEFERIHPFQDGNGRVGRLIAFKECLHYNIVPFFIEDRKKYYYYRGLANWKDERGWLIDTCLDGQDTFKKLLKVFGVNW